MLSSQQRLSRLFFAPEAVEDLRALKANVRARVRMALDAHLS
jgi:hypothetical protein